MYLSSPRADADPLGYVRTPLEEMISRRGLTLGRSFSPSHQKEPLKAGEGALLRVEVLLSPGQQLKEAAGFLHHQAREDLLNRLNLSMLLCSGWC
ncbi:Hypp4416 [Branchiostoma lanceolatum]|uniref:Hypp4416 protein n=1 Tax=Branchiostoma lanceolatum TaxID=7740 RepID=A0A8K0A8S4_BRALA|nr:Hypp4416 [Branchiostoma lanceolatum]